MHALGHLGLLAALPGDPRELEQRAEACGLRVTRDVPGRARGKACRRKENRRFFGKSKRRPVASLFLPRSVFWQCDG